ncbi:MAG TPA: BamA/TamA family outer membrane protein, partial [Chitinophagaceae bacterium]|nr:BamA/TamA family outer membrane protein [Chitinophagaceae bacterium]
MSKLKLLLLLCFVLFSLHRVAAQSYPVYYTITGDSAQQDAQLKNQFASGLEAAAYLNEVLNILQKKGFVTASIDSIRQDSSAAYVQLYLGHKYKWARINTSPGDEDILSALRWPKAAFASSALNMEFIDSWQQQILNHLEDRGHPFAKVYLDSLKIEEDQVEALLKIDRGGVYKIDSIRVWGNAKISKTFLQGYLDLPDGSNYSKKKLSDVSRKISEIGYVEEEKPSTVSLQGTGSVLNLYLKQKKTSQVNALIGFLPNTNTNESKKFVVTGEANLLLKNALGSGETIGLNWQQLQIKAPRLNILFDYPYIFKSPVGLNFVFDLLRKDSSFVNINMQLGTTYLLGNSQSAMIFLQRRQSILSTVDTLQLRQFRQLPTGADVKSTNLGISFSYQGTNYRFNPHKGNELSVTGSAGTKKIKKNNQVVALKDPFFNYESLYDTIRLSTYQFRMIAAAAHYFPLTKQTVLKTAINLGFFQSGNYYLNELFQIGGYKLLRGFNEESEYVSRYIVGTLEYRYLIGVNSNFFAFLDGGWAR